MNIFSVDKVQFNFIYIALLAVDFVTTLGLSSCYRKCECMANIKPMEMFYVSNTITVIPKVITEKLSHYHHLANGFMFLQMAQMGFIVWISEKPNCGKWRQMSSKIDLSKYLEQCGRI